MAWSDLSHQSEPRLLTGVASLALVLTPTVLLGSAAAWLWSLPLAIGAVVQLVYAIVFVRQHPVWRPPVAPSVVVMYLVALGWCWLVGRTLTDTLLFLVQGLLIIMAVGLFAVHDLIRSGAEPLRRAKNSSRKLTGRRDWPMHLSECRSLPEVQELRASVRDSAAPALALLSDPRAEVQTAALAALEYRQSWLPGEAELVLKVGLESQEPAVRTEAAYALAGVKSEELIHGLATLLRDPTPEVRRAAAEALLWDGDQRWPMARAAIHAALADPKKKYDGPLFAGAVRMPAMAIEDLTLWASERPPVAGRAIEILMDQYHRGLADSDRPELASNLAQQMLDMDTSPALRAELAALLRDHHMLTPELLDRLTNAGQPGPLRLLAAEVMLRLNPNDPDGLDVLRGLARQTNRELALAIGAILQNILGLAIGLPQGQIPAAGSKMAADVARRVLAWANGATPDKLRSTTPMPSPGIKGKSLPPIPGLQATNIVPTTRKPTDE